ncbi:MAG: ribosome maturation factor RimM [Pseudomonadota bacterium]
MSTSVAPPDDLILLGYISGAYGLGGWVRIKPYATESEVLLTAKTWWLDKPELHDVDMLQAKLHGGDVVAQLMGVVNRDLAEGLRGAAVHVSRARFPALTDDEYYWVDLIGLDVENLQGESLGRVADMMDNGAHPILRVAASVDSEKAVDDRPTELLIPFVDQFIKTVDQSARKIVVDWGWDY